VANTETNALDLDTHPHITAILVLSDISKLFENAGSDRSTAAKRLCESHVKMKLLFYCAHMLSTRSSILNAIADEVIAEIGGLS
jgi:hypothetical protein